MNLAREKLNAFDTQILLCLERWSYTEASHHANHLLGWAGMRIHLIGSTERPVVTDRLALTSVELLGGEYGMSPDIARARWY